MSSAPGVGILGFGFGLPETVRENDFWQGALKAHESEQRARDILSLDRTTRGQKATMPPEIAAAVADLGDDPFRGARRRRVLDRAMEPSDLEAEAGRRALKNAGVAPEDIDVVMVSTLMPDLLHPSNAPAVQAKCGLTSAAAWSFDLGCASFQPHLTAAAALIRTGTYRHILMVYGASVSPTLDYSTLTSVAFGDGAAAVVVGALSPGQGLLGHYARTDGSLRHGVNLCPVVAGRFEPRWYEQDGPIRFCSLDPEVGKRSGMLSTTFCKDACEGALRSAGVDLSDIKFFVANQSVGWMVGAFRRTMGFSAEQTVDTFDEVGNIGAAAIPYNLHRAYLQGRLADGDLVLIYSPGAGLTRAAVVYRFVAPRQAEVDPGFLKAA
jgi:3-oxoacyl-[acyl-carrier-protein] synthase-3